MFNNESGTRHRIHHPQGHRGPGPHQARLGADHHAGADDPGDGWKPIFAGFGSSSVNDDGVVGACATVVTGATSFVGRHLVEALAARGPQSETLLADRNGDAGRRIMRLDVGDADQVERLIRSA